MISISCEGNVWVLRKWQYLIFFLTWICNISYHFCNGRFLLSNYFKHTISMKRKFQFIRMLLITLKYTRKIWSITYFNQIFKHYLKWDTLRWPQLFLDNIKKSIKTNISTWIPKSEKEKIPQSYKGCHKGQKALCCLNMYIWFKWQQSQRGKRCCK